MTNEMTNEIAESSERTGDLCRCAQSKQTPTGDLCRCAQSKQTPTGDLCRCARSGQTSPVSPARLRANRENAKKSTGPKSPDGKKRSSLNATRHGILSQVIHLPEEELKSYSEFTASYVASLAPVGAAEIQLANACADLQFRLHRLAAAEHNLFSIGHSENGDEWETGHPESHTALAFAETMRRSKDPLNTLSTYESRLSRRFLQTLKQLREIQADRREREAEELHQMFEIAYQHPDQVENMEPSHFGFVCSTHDWKLYFKRRAAMIPPVTTLRKRRAA